MIPFVPTTPDTSQRRRSLFSSRLSKPKASRSQSTQSIKSKSSQQSSNVPGIVVSDHGTDDHSGGAARPSTFATSPDKSFSMSSEDPRLSSEQIQRVYEPSLVDSTFEQDDESTLNPTHPRNLYSSANSSESQQPLLGDAEPYRDVTETATSAQSNESHTYTANAMSVVRQEQPGESSADGEESEREWKASYWDTSSLSEEQIAKLKKKGINPALYLEMKAARKGKKISPLCGSVWFA